MAEAVRRLLGLVPVLLVGSIVLFFLLGRHPDVQHERQLPLFFQRHPVSAASAALEAMRGTARGDARSARELEELGGAALPHILPRLSELAVKERRRVADALEPVARRMQIEAYRDATPPSMPPVSAEAESDRRLLAWERYYEDHDLDFRPLSVERLVRRLSSRRSGTREGDLLAVDTYALPHLVRALGRVDGPDDVKRVQRLAPAIASLSGESLSEPDLADVEGARALATGLRRDFDRRGARFTDLGRLESLTAHVTQTEFALWWVQASREARGVDSPLVFSNLTRAFTRSAPLLAAGFVGALILGPLAAAFLELALLRRLGSAAFRRTRRGLSLTCTLSLPLCLLGPSSRFVSLALVLFVATLASASTLWGELSRGVDWRSSRVLGERPLRGRLQAIAASLAVTLPTLLPLISGEVFLWVACLELSRGGEGLFPDALEALRGGELHALLALSLLSWGCIAIVQALSDALLPPGDPSWGPS